MQYFSAVVFLKPGLFTMTLLEEKQNWKIKKLFASKLSWKWHWKLKNCTIHCATSSILHVNNKTVWMHEAYLEVWEVFWVCFFSFGCTIFSSVPISHMLIISVDFFCLWECHQVEKSSEQLKFYLDYVSTWILKDIWAVSVILVGAEILAVVSDWMVCWLILEEKKRCNSLHAK